jgi:hypothetical protein
MLWEVGNEDPKQDEAARYQPCSRTDGDARTYMERHRLTKKPGSSPLLQRSLEECEKMLNRISMF